MARENPVYTSMSSRSWKRLDPVAFRLALEASPLCYAAAWSELDIDSLARLYNTEITSILDHLGNADQKRWAELIIEKRWGATMVLTEPDAGSDLASLQSLAATMGGDVPDMPGRQPQLSKRGECQGDEKSQREGMHLLFGNLRPHL